jgi:hypothetical protein
MSNVAKNHADKFVEFWDEYFIKNKIGDPLFTTRLVFYPKEWKGEKQGITLFRDELPKEGEVLYIELTNNEMGTSVYTPYGIEKGVRCLYKLEHNVNAETEYDAFDRVSKSTNTPYKVIGVSIEQLTLCSERLLKHNVEEKKEISKNLLDSIAIADLPDLQFSSMTMRDFYCILHNIPMTTKMWLNDLIKEHGRKEDSTPNGGCSCKN